ncbi:hypothetical protein [Paenibacillus polymyxa]|uniref:hypothetical protein n=1 Tax=Paenibacillus polymyxa TaxID=1406 RepID=UPI002ED49F32|nr:hypothetical protein [Paenibacillus polymyxa]
MTYSQLVDKYIKESGLSLGEIAKRMQEEKNIKIDRSYISKLRNDPKYPASEEINRALAEITGGDPEELVWASYYEKAPLEVKSALEKGKLFEKLIKQFIKLNSEDSSLSGDIETLLESLNNPSPEKAKQVIDEMIDKVFEKSTPETLLELFTYTDDFKNNNSDPGYLTKLKELRESKKLSNDKAAELVNLKSESYKNLEIYGGVKKEGGTSEKINAIYEKAIEILSKYTPPTRENEEFKEFINNPQHGVFFRDYLEAPEERKRELMQFWRFIQETEKNRKPGDRQGE